MRQQPPCISRVPTMNCFTALMTANDKIVVDSGASTNFAPEPTPSTNRTHAHSGVTMVSATGDHQHSIATDFCDSPLPNEAHDVHVFRNGNIHWPLLSMEKACDAGCKVLFESPHCTFFKDDMATLRECRNQHGSSLHLLPKKAKDNIAIRDRNRCCRHNIDTTTSVGLGLPPQPTLCDLNAHSERTVSGLMQCPHACAGFPTVGTWTKAIDRGHCIGWPSLTASRVKKHLPKSKETVLAHQNLVRQGVCSTSKGVTDGDNDTSKGAEAPKTPIPSAKSKQRNAIACSFPCNELQGVMGTDQTGRPQIGLSFVINFAFKWLDSSATCLTHLVTSPAKTRSL